MNILMVAAENGALPKGKVGGIGDVIRDVPIELCKQGHQVGVITPGYGIHIQHQAAEFVQQFYVAFGRDILTVELYQIADEKTANLTHWIVEHKLFSPQGIGKIYCDDGAKRPFASDASKFALFCACVATLLSNQWHSQFQILHLHDWHAAFVALLREYDPKFIALQDLRCVYTIHNLALQGIRPLANDDSSLASWFPRLYIQHEKVVDPRYPDCINPMRAGINLADCVHVVSPTYATEVVQPSNAEHGFIGGEGLEVDLQNAQAQDRLLGILNGCDYDVSLPRISKTQLWRLISTELEQWIAAKPQVMSAHFLAFNRLSIWQTKRFSGPLVTSIGRLTLQKMALLVRRGQQATVLDDLLMQLAQFDGRLLLLGSGDPQLENVMTQVMARHSNLLFLNGYGESLSDAIYSLGDLFLMPSSFEPCGISQLLAMRAGQPCLVHQIGGLADTVKHLETGFSFAGNSPEQQIAQLLAVFKQALQLHQQQPRKWQTIVKQAKAQRFEWKQSVQAYIEHLYR